MKYTDRQRLQKILDYADKLLVYLAEHQISKEQLMSDFALQWLVTTPLYNIGEQVYCLSDDYKKQHPAIQWLMIAGLRHRLVHDYDGTNWKIIIEVVFEELPILRDQMRALLEEEP